MIDRNHQYHTLAHLESLYTHSHSLVHKSPFHLRKINWSQTTSPKRQKDLRGCLSTYSTPSLHQLTSPRLTINDINLDNTKLTKHTFQGLMNSIFKPFLRKILLVFFDDILIYNKSRKNHIQNVDRVLSYWRRNNYMQKPPNVSLEYKRWNIYVILYLMKVLR